jgi:glycosyltransferase involved in cell wall biosynthesis
MNVWILNHYAGDENRQTTGNYDIGRCLVAKGHQVTIFASGFSHYKFREERLQPGESWKAEDHQGVRFVWLKTFPYRGNDWRRAANMLSYAVRVAGRGFAETAKPDVVIGTCPHTLAVLAAWALAAYHRAVFFYEIRDLWPQTLIDFGALSEGSPVTWALKMLERFLCGKARRVITVLPSLGDYIAGLGLAREKLVYIPNGVDLARYEGMTRYDGGANGVFTLMYLGGLARYNGVEVIVEAANLLRGEGQNRLKFVIVGEGPRKTVLRQRAQELALENVELRPLVPKAQIGSVMSEASAFIHHIQNIPVLKYGISSNKLFDYMSAGRPIIFAVNSPNNPVAGAEAGLTIPPEDPIALAQAVLELLAKSPEERIQMGKNGRAYVERNHSVEVLAGRLESACLAALNERDACGPPRS